jgi:hypothetical protein
MALKKTWLRALEKGIIRIMRMNAHCQNWLMAVAVFCIAASAAGPQPKTVVFEKRQGIAAPPSRIFSIVTNFQDYSRLFPESHSQVTIVSALLEGAGVVFDNVATYKGRTVRSRWTVTEFVRDRLVRMDSDSAGTVIVLLHQVDYDTTEETLIASVNVLPQYKDEILAQYDREMKALKAACEQQAPAAPQAEPAKAAKH